MEKKENIREYLQKMLDRWNKYDELDGFVAENFRVDLEKTLEYWDLRISDNEQELDKAREEGRREVYKAIVFDENIPHDITTFVAANLWKNMRDKAKEELSKLKDNK